MTGVRLILLAATAVVLAGCGGLTSSWHSDNPAIREIQKAETARHIADGEEKEGLRRYLGERVRIVFSGDIRDHSQGFPPAGRAAALTRDGYFLTAYHVVEDGPFYLQESKQIRKPPGGRFKSSEISRYFSERRYPGRLVWSDPSADIAIVKFPVTDHPCFEGLGVAPAQGSRVFTADDEGYGTIAADEHGVFRLGNHVGNGDFFAAGKIAGAAKGHAGSGGFTLSTTLVARRGMSGAPVMTASHRLCGVLSRVEGFVPFRSPRSIAAMMDPGRISELIDADRRMQKREAAGAPKP